MSRSDNPSWAIDWRSWLALGWASWFGVLYGRMVLVERFPGLVATLRMWLPSD